jgi:hypothetical protein
MSSPRSRRRQLHCPLWWDGCHGGDRQDRLCSIVLSSTPRAWRRESREFSFCCFFTTHEPVNASTIGQRTSRSWMGPMVADAHWLAKTDLCTFPGVGQGRSLLITTLAQLREERNPTTTRSTTSSIRVCRAPMASEGCNEPGGEVSGRERHRQV